MIKIYALFFYLLVWNIGADAQTFWKKYAPVYGGMSDLIWVAPNEYAFISPGKLVLTDGLGEIKKEWEPAAPGMSLTNLIRTSTGKFVIAAIKNETTPALYLFLLDAQLQQEQVVRLTFDDALLSQELLPGLNGNFYLVYQKRQPGKPGRLVVQQMDEDGQENWKSELPEGVLYRYAVQPGENGGIEVAFSGAQDAVMKIWKFTVAGGKTEFPIMPLFTQDEGNLPEFFARTADGGYFFAATEVPLSLYTSNTEIVVMRTDAGGRILWKKLIDLNINDELTGMVADATGLYLLSISGPNMSLYEKGSKAAMTLSRLDMQGDLKWVKAFGNSSNDHWATNLVQAPDGVLIGGYCWDRHGATASVLLKAGLDGSFNDPAFSLPVQPSALLTIVQLPLPAKTQEMVHTLPLQDGAYLATVKLIGVTEDEFTACVLKLDTKKQIEWYQFLSEKVSKPGRLYPTSDGNYACLLWEYDETFRYIYLVKISSDGTIIWKKNITGAIIQDMAPTADGGFMLVGYSQSKASVTKLDAAGVELWTQSHAFPNFSITGEFIQATSDQHFIIAGKLINGAMEEVGISLLKTDANGGANWIRAYKRTDTLIQAKSLMVTGGHALIGGFSESYISGNRDAYLLKTDLSGNLAWSAVYDISGMDGISAILPKSDTAYCVAGTTGELSFGRIRQYGFLSNIRTDGTMNDCKFYGEGGPDFSITNAFAGSEGKLQFAGHRQERYGVALPFIGSAEQVVLSTDDDAPIRKNIQLYPNPARGITWLKVSNNYSGEIRISITGTNGQLMNSVSTRKTSGTVNIPLHTGDLPGGLYAIEIRMGKERVLKQLIVLH